MYTRSVILTLWLCYCEGKRERQGVRLLFYLPHNTVLIITLSKRSYEPELNFMRSVSARTTSVWAHLSEFMFLMILKTFKCTNVSLRLGLHLSEAFIQRDLQCIQVIHFFFQYMCFLGIEPITFALLMQCSTTEPQEHIALKNKIWSWSDEC